MQSSLDAMYASLEPVPEGHHSVAEGMLMGAAMAVVIFWLPIALIVARNWG